VNVVFQFTAKGESLGYFWSVSCQYKKRPTKEDWRALLLAGLLLSMVTCLVCCNVSGKRVVLGWDHTVIAAARQMNREDIEQWAIDNGCPTEQM
jgi:nicotinamide riboside transporter PnuC